MPYEGLLQVFGVIAVFEWYSMTHKKGKWAGAVRDARGIALAPSRSRALSGRGRAPQTTQDAWFTGLDSVVDQNFDPLGFGNADAAAVDRAKLQELEHGARGSERRAPARARATIDPTSRPPRRATGRLAMLGAMSVVAACEIPGSVPLLKL